MLRIFFFVLNLFIFHSLVAQQGVPVIRTSSDRITALLNDQRANLFLQYLPNPFYYQLIVPDSGVSVQIHSEKDTVHFVLTQGEKEPFLIIQQETGDTIPSLFSGVKKVDPVNFPKSYIRKHKGKHFFEIPQVYELVNIIIAITQKGLNDPNLVYRETPYYNEVIDHFKQYQNEPIVGVVNKLLETGRYSHVKMDSYSFYFNGNRIKKSPIYNRISWGEQNVLDEYVSLLEDFAIKSDFLPFFDRNKKLYKEYVKSFKNIAELDRIHKWLEKNFPSTNYDSYKIIFSPLVAYNQSSNYFEDNGFKEAQAHVNFPHRSTNLNVSEEAKRILKQTIVFTELNHSYINPEAERYTTRINVAFKDLYTWGERGKAAEGYNTPVNMFNEYMNYGLFALYLSDQLREEEFETVNALVERNMVNNRGFKEFSSFNQFLLNLYQSKQPDETIAGLYPRIVDWFQENSR